MVRQQSAYVRSGSGEGVNTGGKGRVMRNEAAMIEEIKKLLITRGKATYDYWWEESAVFNLPYWYVHGQNVNTVRALDAPIPEVVKILDENLGKVLPPVLQPILCPGSGMGSNHDGGNNTPLTHDQNVDTSTALDAPIPEIVKILDQKLGKAISSVLQPMSWQWDGSNHDGGNNTPLTHDQNVDTSTALDAPIPEIVKILDQKLGKAISSVLQPMSWQCDGVKP
eukprot:gene28109-31219_t